MAAITFVVGVKSISLTLSQSFQKKKKLNGITPLFDQNANFVEVDGRDPSWEFSCSGQGDLPSSLALGGSISVSGVSGGKTIIREIDQANHHDKYNEWSWSGENWPSA